MTRVVVVATTYPRWRGDPEPGFVHELSRRLAARGFEVAVVCPHALGALARESMDGVEVVRCRYAPARWETLVNGGGILANLRRSGLGWILLPALFLALAAGLVRTARRADVVHAHWLVPQGLLALGLQRLRLLRAPVVATAHGADLFALRGAWFTRLRRWVVRNAAATTVVSEAMRERLAQEAGGTGAPVQVRPMGVDLRHRFTAGDEPRLPHRLLFVGRLVEKKGLRHLIDALPAIRAAHADVTLDIAGFGPEFEPLRVRVRERGLEDVVSFLGAVTQEDLVPLYRRATLFVAPFVAAASGDQEGLGLVMIEALGCGCPIVAGAVPAAADVLDALPAGAVPPGEVDALAREIVRLLDDPALRAAQIEAARRIVLPRFDWETVADGYAALIAGAAAR